MSDDTFSPNTSHIQSERQTLLLRFFLVLTVFVVLSLLFISGLYFLNTPSQYFPVATSIVIPEGSGVNAIAITLAQKHVVRSEIFFKLATVLTATSQSLHAGTYTFPTPLSTFGVVDALAHGTYSDTSVILTFPEGVRITAIATIVAKALPNISVKAFIASATPYEGYLFPETYHVSPHAEIADIVMLMHKTFDERAHSLAIPPDEKQRSAVVTLASILEREGNSPESMKIISGILQRRMANNMPLQADATLEYERNKGSAELTLADLAKDSPYNTYTRKGLPPTPISNPGSTALNAALHPTVTPFLYYLSDAKGNFHYAKTFEEHKRNKARYLRS